MNIFLRFIFTALFLYIYSSLVTFFLGLFWYYVIRYKEYGHFLLGSTMVYFPFNKLLKSKIVKLCPYKDCSNAKCDLWTCPNYKSDINSSSKKLIKKFCFTIKYIDSLVYAAENLS